MAAIIGIPKAIFGSGSALPLSGFPEGKARIRVRPNAFARVFIRNKQGITEFIPVEKDGKWIPGYQQGQNLTP